VASALRVVNAAIYQRIQTDDDLQIILGATTSYFCQVCSHPNITQFDEFSNRMITHAANKKGLKTQADFDHWLISNQLNDPEYFLSVLLQKLETIIGDSWLFDVAAFLPEK
jgi:hypothetical protein